MSFRTYREVAGEDRSGLAGQLAVLQRRVDERLAGVKHVVAVMSGKGGVGKSYVGALLARGLASEGRAVGVLDADLEGPTIARTLCAAGPATAGEAGVRPAAGDLGIKVVSSELFLGAGRPLRWSASRTEEFVWRGSLEHAALREFLSDVEWGDLDVLVIDLPPGTGGVMHLLGLVPGLGGLIAVTIPSEESRASVERAVRFSVDAGASVLGLVENMRGYLCPGCKTEHELFEGSAADDLSRVFDVPVLARLPFIPGPGSVPPDLTRGLARALDGRMA